MKYLKLIFPILFLFIYISCNSNNNSVATILEIENCIEKEEYKIALNKIENLNLKDFYYYNLKGKCLMYMNNGIRLRNANKMFYYAYLYQPKNIDNLFLLAESFFEIKEVRKALKYYNKCLKICNFEKNNNRLEMIYERLIEINFISGNYEKTLKYIDFIKPETFSNYISAIKIISTKKILNYKIESFDIESLFYDKMISKNKLYIIFDSFIPDDIELLKNIVKQKNLNFSEQFCKVCFIYKIYFLLINNKNETASECIAKLQKEDFVDWQFDKIISFYYWNIRNYELANWNADFYFFRFYHFLKQNIKKSNSKKTFEKKFRHDAMFKFLKMNSV